MKKIALSLALASSLMFGASDHTNELTALIGGVKPEGNLDLENQLSLGLRFGTYVQNAYVDMLEFGIDRVNSADFTNSTRDTHINRFFINMIKEYEITKDTAWYGLAGIGYEDFGTTLFGNDDDGFVQYGVGLKHWVTENFALKAEARHGVTFDGNNNLFYTLGFTVPFGKKAQAAPAPVVQPTPAPEPVVIVPAPAPAPVVIDPDKDHDGVANAIDKCPNTPEGTIVNDDGCLKMIRLHVNFAYDSDAIKAEEYAKIYKVTEFLIANPDFTVLLDGHTDAKGSKTYNQTLGLQRAQAVAALLKDKGIPATKIITRSYGEDKPVASNEDAAGRALNRRVDAHFQR